MKENIQKSSKVALLVSNSHLWGLWFYKALISVNLSIEPILVDQIDDNFSKKYCALFVPGGWSKNKLESLSERQREIIREFLQKGGLYFGICGGASLAGAEGLGIIQVRRKKERIPSYSGPSLINAKDKVLFQNIKKPLFYLWFPPEWDIAGGKDLKILATFSQALPSAYTSDLCLGDHYDNLDYYEKIYGIPLHPEKMKDKVLFIEASYGKGNVFLSLIHFDTPNCQNSKIFWKNFISRNHLPLSLSEDKSPKSVLSTSSFSLAQNLLRKTKNLYKKVNNLLHFGVRNFLYHQRYSFFYQWKRGIRGLELLNLYYMFREIINTLRHNFFSTETLEKISLIVESLENTLPLVLKGLEKDMYGFLYKEKILKEEEEREIFGANVKSYGGIYKEVINRLEEILVYLWQAL
ncbi:MAG: BPL-N domain-containing protein [Caldimicrobium sp.]